ncbi:NUDIX hydrolase [Idiomarina xiamenensis]|uniref:Nudix hydrolase domain-containing protein n=1 Tax=Idiomarina xiamenensis 10-D-4 TaxID=740709 RepID=K2JMJ5_9GAMM|nr:NUDIX domain-containing protein [Idiomarina xiamenensis]EKE84736.1 hypothetical protein A10D4_03960 [Idiomarina xiamenensis 10-D-4]
MALALIDKLGWILIADNALLAVRSHGKDKFYLPGGKRDAGESDEQALCREIGEELTVRLRPQSLHFYDELRAQADAKNDGTEVRLRCYFADYDGHLQAAAEIAELAWLSMADLPRCSLALQLLMQQLHQQQRL